MAVDQRFYITREALTFGSIIDRLGLPARDGSDRSITGIASYEAAVVAIFAFLREATLLSRAPYLGSRGLAWSTGLSLAGFRTCPS